MDSAPGDTCCRGVQGTIQQKGEREDRQKGIIQPHSENNGRSNGCPSAAGAVARNR
jgi:hypothetical protein